MQTRAYDRVVNLVACTYQRPSPPNPSTNPQQLKLLSRSRRRSIWHSKGQRSVSSGKVTDIITWYLTFKQFTSHLPYTYLRYFLYSSAPVWQWRLLVRRSGIAGRCNVALCTLPLDLTYGSGYTTAVCLHLTLESERNVDIIHPYQSTLAFRLRSWCRFNPGMLTYCWLKVSQLCFGSAHRVHLQGSSSLLRLLDFGS